MEENLQHKCLPSKLPPLPEATAKNNLSMPGTDSLTAVWCAMELLSVTYVPGTVLSELLSTIYNVHRAVI